MKNDEHFGDPAYAKVDTTKLKPICKIKSTSRDDGLDTLQYLAKLEQKIYELTMIKKEEA